MEMQTGTPSAGPTKSNNKLLIIIAVVILALIIFGWLATFVIGKVVGFGFRKAIEGATGFSVEGEGETGTITFKGGDGETGTIDFGGVSGTKEQKLPKNFPSYFPIMGGTKATATLALSSAEGTSYTVNWETNASLETVADFYSAELSKNGWSISTEVEGDDSTTFLAQRGADPSYPDASGWVTVSTDQGKTVIGLSLTVFKR